MQSTKSDENIVLIDNREVSEYINYVYDMYDIRDPMQTNLPERTAAHLRNSKRTFTGTPSMRKKSSASELKDKIVLHRDIDLESYNAYSSRKEDTRFDFSLKADRSREKAH